MQRFNPTHGAPARVFHDRRLAALAAIAAVTLAGCNKPAPGPAESATPSRPFAGVALVVACADGPFAQGLKARAAGWAGRTGASVRVEARPPADVPEANAVVVPPAGLGAFAGQLAPLPPALRAADHPLQRPRIVETYRDALVGWGGDVYGVPLLGDGFALVSRADRLNDPALQARFQAAANRAMATPQTYEDMAETAAVMAKLQGKPALPALPADPAALLQAFHQVAACYDRPAQTDAAKSGGAGGPRDNSALSFHLDAQTGRPRLDAPGFRAAAAFLAQTRGDRTPTGDAPAALEADAVFAVLSLAEVGRLPRDPATGAVAARYQVSRLPGTRSCFDASGKAVKAAGTGNYVPYLGGATLVGAVRKTPAAPLAEQAAWDLLADLASPAGSLSVLGDPALGSGDFRREHLEAARDPVWLGYRFDAAGTARLAAAARDFVAAGVVNPATPLRTPDQAELMALLADAVGKAARGELSPDAAMAQAQAAWLAHDEKQKPEELARWRRNAIGLP